MSPELSQSDLDALLSRVLSQARAIGIPVSGRIDPHVALNRRATGRFGCCRVREGVHVIELSAPLLAAGEGAVLETLAHEVLHTCWGCKNHGPRWKGYAQRMNAAYGYHISRTNTWEALGLPDPKKANHLVVCRRCGREFKRARASSLVLHPERYRCRCGGTLERKF